MIILYILSYFLLGSFIVGLMSKVLNFNYQSSDPIFLLILVWPLYATIGCCYFLFKIGEKGFKDGN